MPGVTMETEQEGGGKEKCEKPEDIVSPQRSILEFFKSPNKPEKKGKDLMSYFGKSSAKPNGTSKPVVNETGKDGKTTEKLNGHQNGIKKQNGKTKNLEKEAKKLNSSLNEFDVNDSLKTKSKCMEKKKGTKKSLSMAKINNETSKENEGKSDESKGQQNGIATEKDSLEKIQKKGKKGDLKTKSKTKNNMEEKMLCKTSKEEKTIENKEKETGSEKMDITHGDVANENAGMSYLDFLKTLDKDEDKHVNGEDPTAVDNTMEVDAQPETSAVSCPEAENLPSIKSYFTKITGTSKNELSNKDDIPVIVTTTADIHTEPTPPKVTKGHNLAEVKKCSPLVSDTKINEIEILSSEVVNVDSSSKKQIPKKKGRESKSARKSLNQKLSVETVEISDDSLSVDITENKEATERKKAFLQSSEKPVNVQKTAQSTLSFTKGGMQMTSKPSHVTRVRSSEIDEVNCESPLSKSTPKRGRGRPPGSLTKKTDKMVYDAKEIKKVLKMISEEKSEETESSRKKSLRKKYKVDMISIDNKNKTPIRMRLKRCNKSGSSTDESFVALRNKTNIKQSKAQKLLEKAKKTKAGLSPEQKLQIKKNIEKNLKKKGTKEKSKRKDNTKEETSDNTGRRRSSRLSDIHQKSMNESQHEDEVMIIDDEEEKVKGRKKKMKDVSTPRKERNPSTPKTPKVNTPSKGRKVGTPKKPSGKLAPIFMKKKTAEELKKVILDPEQERLRREFLMSGVPEALKKQTAAASEAAILAELPPFPDIKHVQQIQEVVGKSGINVWALPGVALKYVEMSQYCPKICWEKCLLEKDKLKCDLTNLKKFKQHTKIEDSLLDSLLKEIQRVSLSYNVEKMYNLLKEKKDDQDAEVSAEVEEQKENKNDKGGKDKDSEEKGHKSKKRRSLRLKKKDEIMEIIDLGSPEPVNKEECGSTENKQEAAIVVPWTDKYQPTHSSEIVGNSNNIKKLKSWLTEWQQRVCKEARKMKKLMMKETKDKSKDKDDDWWGNDDSDFDLDNEDSEDEDDRLCNTVMLMGPNGIGKTTTVYALAQEIGFKVFEVNASSIRNGKRILSQLQEATQSHRVAHKKGDGTSTLLSTPGKTCSPQKKPEKKMATSFANFFKKATPTEADKQKKPKEDKKGRKRKRVLEDSDLEKTPKKKKENKIASKDQKGVQFDGLIPSASNQTTATSKGLNLASTSLILFEDVDIIFEEDKGFWSAIQTFMSTTKIPIVLTTNDVTLSSKFEGRYEQYLFRIPSMKQTTVYLQLICLAEGVRTNSEEIMTLVKVLSGDIRRCLLALQYWVDSGGGTLQETQKINPLLKLRPLSITEDTCSQDSMKKFSTVFNENSKSRLGDDDDFVSIKPVINRRKRPFISDDESSNSAQPFPPSIASSEKSESLQMATTHLSCLNSSLGLNLGGSQGIMNLLKQFVKGQNDDLVTMVTEACEQYRKLMYNIVYNTYTDLLPIPKSHHSSPPSLKRGQKKEKKTHLKRIKTFDLYDSEASNDGLLDEKPVEEKEEEVPKNETKEETIASIKSLNALTEFYDNMSFIDSITTCNEIPESSNSFISHSKRTLHDFDTLSEHIDKDNLCSEIEVRTLYKLCVQQEEIQDSVKHQHFESISIPSMCSVSQGALVNRANNSTNLVLKKAFNNIMSNLPLNIRCHQKTVVRDYLPTLRDICKSEKLREIAKAKRRFYHYFDNIGLTLKDTTMDVLYTSFQ